MDNSIQFLALTAIRKNDLTEAGAIERAIGQ